MTVLNYEELAERLAAEVSAATRVMLDLARGVANEAGIVAARHELRDAFEAITAKQDAVRVAREQQRAAKDELADAVADATWQIEAARLVVEGPRTRFWVTDEDETEMVEQFDDDGGSLGVSPQPTGEKKRKPVTAEEAKKLLDDELRRHPAVRAAQRSYDQAVDATQTAIEAVTTAERRFSAAKHDLDAAAVQLQVLALAIPREETR